MGNDICTARNTVQIYSTLTRCGVHDYFNGWPHPLMCQDCQESCQRECTCSMFFILLDQCETNLLINGKHTAWCINDIVITVSFESNLAMKYLSIFINYVFLLLPNILVRENLWPRSTHNFKGQLQLGSQAFQIVTRLYSTFFIFAVGVQNLSSLLQLKNMWMKFIRRSLVDQMSTVWPNDLLFNYFMWDNVVWSLTFGQLIINWTNFVHMSSSCSQNERFGTPGVKKKSWI